MVKIYSVLLTSALTVMPLIGCGFIHGYTTGGASSSEPTGGVSFDSVTPLLLDSAGGQTLTLAGSGFDSSLQISLNGRACSQMQVISKNSATCTSPAQPSVSPLLTALSINGSSTDSKMLRSYTPLGQATASSNRQLEHGLYIPTAMRNCGVRVALLDGANNRILIWNQMPASQFVAPDYVIGQRDLSTADANLGGQLSPSNMTPAGFTCNASKLLVADSYNNRVLVWNTFPTLSFQPADLVLGQPNFQSAAVAPASASTMLNPTDIAIGPDGGVYVVDAGNNRILAWPTFPTTNNQPAVRVIGQSSFSASAASVSQTGLQTPNGIVFIGTKLLVSDAGNRVLVWNSIPSTNGPAADVVIGQTDFVSQSGATSSTKIQSPSSLATDGTSLYLSDTSASRGPRPAAGGNLNCKKTGTPQNGCYLTTTICLHRRSSQCQSNQIS